MFHKFIYQIGAKIRNPGIFSYYHFLKESEKWSLEELEAYQLKKLKELVKQAYEKTTFYRELYQKNGIIPEDLKSLNDLKNIPIVTKQDLLLNAERIQIKEGFHKLVHSSTSGTSGERLNMYRSETWDSGTRAAQLRGYSWFGVKPWQKNGYVSGYDPSGKNRLKIRCLDSLINRFRIFSFGINEIESFSSKLKKASYLEGYSSMIYEIAKIINEKQWNGDYSLNMVKGTSEMIYESYQDEIRKAFGHKMISEYGATETGIVSFECPEGNLHIVMENVIVEEENGEAVITNLLSSSFPIIRYKVGDYIELMEDKICKCGMQHKMLKTIKGRAGNVIYGQNQKYPSCTFYHVFKNLYKKHHIQLSYQVIHPKRGQIDLYLDKEISEREAELLQNEAKIYFGNDVSIKLFPNQLRRDHSKKFKDFISQVEEDNK